MTLGVILPGPKTSTIKSAKEFINDPPPNHLVPRTLRGKLLLVVDIICLLMLLSTPFVANKPELIGPFPYVYVWAIIWGGIWILLLNIIGHTVKK